MFWTVCKSCEALVAQADDDANLASLMVANEGYSFKEAEGAVRTFRSSDLGPTPLATA